MTPNQMNGRFQRTDHSVCQCLQFCRILVFLDNCSKLIATETREKVGPSHYVSKPSSHFNERLVPRVMSKLVIDGLKSVQVHVKHGKIFMTSLRQGKNSPEMLIKAAPVRNIGQHVVCGLIAEFIRNFLGINNLLKEFQSALIPHPQHTCNHNRQHCRAKNGLAQTSVNLQFNLSVPVLKLVTGFL